MAVVPAIEYAGPKSEEEESNVQHFFGNYMDKIAALKKLTQEANAELAEIDSDSDDDINKKVISSSQISALGVGSKGKANKKEVEMRGSQEINVASSVDLDSQYNSDQVAALQHKGSQAASMVSSANG